MRIILLGDISLHDDRAWSGPDELPWFDGADYVLANLEGPIVSPQHLSVPQRRVRRPIVYNSCAVTSFLQAQRVTGVWLANNHICDGGQPIARTVEYLRRAGIASFGAGQNLSAASRPLRLVAGGTEAYLFAFGWAPIGCRPTSEGREGVNPLDPSHLFETIRGLRQRDRKSYVAFLLHWNYELEHYPQPAHRQLAHDLIREGVDLIVGSHSHVVEGAELVQGKPVVYGLGNWYFTPRVLGRFKLAFPAVSWREVVLELTIRGREVEDIRFHWYLFDPIAGGLRYEHTEGWDGSVRRELTPFAGMSHEHYVRWFRAHRKRRRGLPVYEDYRQVCRNAVKDRYVGLRQRLINVLVALGAKSTLHG